MTGRLPTHLSVAALVRRVNDAGGFAVVRARGDRDSGTILVLLDEPAGGAATARAVERVRDLDGRDSIIEARAACSESALEEYWQRRRERDPDLWVIELNIPDGERFVAETIGSS